MINKRKKNTKSSVPRKKGSIKIAIVLLIGLTLSTSLFGCDGETGISQGEEVIATVNGEEITKEEFAQAIEQEKIQYQMQGIDLDSEEMASTLKELEQQVLDNYFIIPMLITQQAEKEGITISDEEIEERYQEYVTAFGGEEELLEQMELANMSRSKLDDDIVRELSIQNYLEQYMDKYLEENSGERIIEEEIEIERAELEAYYEQIINEIYELKELMETDDPDIPMEQVEMYFLQLEELYGDILEEEYSEEAMLQLEKEMREQRAFQMKEEKVQRVILEHISNLKENSDIEINI